MWSINNDYLISFSIFLGIQLVHVRGKECLAGVVGVVIFSSVPQITVSSM